LDYLQQVQLIQWLQQMDCLWAEVMIFIWKQVVTVLAVCVYAFIFSYVMLWLINFVTPVKVTKEEEEAGLDSSLHGEMAYEQD
jgi:ammonia channel protein AmtB